MNEATVQGLCLREGPHLISLTCGGNSSSSLFPGVSSAQQGWGGGELLTALAPACGAGPTETIVSPQQHETNGWTGE